MDSDLRVSEMRMDAGLALAMLAMRSATGLEPPTPPPVAERWPEPRIGMDAPRNAPCPCRSGKKYKKCCGPKRAEDGPA